MASVRNLTDQMMQALARGDAPTARRVANALRSRTHRAHREQEIRRWCASHREAHPALCARLVRQMELSEWQREQDFGPVTVRYDRTFNQTDMRLLAGAVR